MPQTLVRPARREDIAAIERLLSAESLPVTPVEPYLSGFTVLEVDGEVAGCAGIEMYSAAAFLRSVVVAPELRGSGEGDRLVRAALGYAQRKQARRVYLFTMHAANFFARHGFESVGIDDFEPAVRAAPQYIGVSQTPEIAKRLTAMRLELS
jgi:N-acetylglutamate synthase-like GNAT family acetyltransferase